jgi:hypothetical protein
MSEAAEQLMLLDRFIDVAMLNVFHAMSEGRISRI